MHAIICKVSELLYKKVENRLLEGLISDTLEKSCAYISGHLNSANFYFLAHQLFEFLAIFCLYVNSLMIDTYLHGEFKHYGWKSLAYTFGLAFESNPRCKVFPVNVGCEIPTSDFLSDDYANSGRCTLTQNSWNQFFFTIIWIWFAISYLMIPFSLILRAVTIMSLKFRIFILQGK